MLFREHVPLAPFTTFKIGGPARWFVEAASESELLEAVDFARTRSLPLFVLGGGSNLLVSDAGFPGLVLRIALMGIEEEPQAAYRLFNVAAGEDWDRFVSLTIDRNCGGIECLAGIPGTVGGTPVQNVGAYGQEVATTIQTVRALDLNSPTLDSQAFLELDHKACGFAYRESNFNRAQRGRYIVTAVRYRLLSAAEPVLSYRDIKQHFNEKPAPTLGEVSQAVRQIRRNKGMLITPGDPDCLSAGSFFKNPIVPLTVLSRITAAKPAPVPQFPAEPGQVKIPAAWLVEQAGFQKGYAVGQAGISSRHSLALINRGAATAADIAALRDKIIAAVQTRFGITLEPEPVWVG